jgi:hypothetical protein
MEERHDSFHYNMSNLQDAGIDWIGKAQNRVKKPRGF